MYRDALLLPKFSHCCPQNRATAPRSQTQKVVLVSRDSYFAFITDDLADALKYRKEPQSRTCARGCGSLKGLKDDWRCAAELGLRLLAARVLLIAVVVVVEADAHFKLWTRTMNDRTGPAHLKPTHSYSLRSSSRQSTATRSYRDSDAWRSQCM